MTNPNDDWALPVPCAVDGVDLKSAGIGWRAVETASDLLFVCDRHTDNDIRDAVNAPETPDSIYSTTTHEADVA